jgi:Protein of unknown function (DUF1566).
MWKSDLTIAYQYQLGDVGPAGGIVFYDKGNNDDGWRFLEAAPSDQSTGITWNNGKNIDIKTDTAVGAGKANTEAIIIAQGNGNYAATLCKKLSINGFTDWFLPSRDELDLMYTNLKKAGLGGFGEGLLWSSSQEGIRNDLALGSGGRGDFKNDRNAVRACRAF